MLKNTSEAAFEAVIESHLLQNGYQIVDKSGFDKTRAIFPAQAIDFIRTTQPKEMEPCQS